MIGTSIFTGRAMLAVKNHNILNGDALHFKLARSVMKIESFQFANLKHFQVHSRLIFMNLKSAWLVWNTKCQIRLQSCSRWLYPISRYVIKFSSSCCFLYFYAYKNEEISKIEKTFLRKHPQGWLVSDGLTNLQQTSRWIPPWHFRKHLVSNAQGLEHIAMSYGITWCDIDNMGTAGID